MIIWVGQNSADFWVEPGDTFTLKIHSEKGEDRQVYEITEPTHITMYGGFVFANQDGTVEHPQYIGFFGDRDNLPTELEDALLQEELSPQQYQNFITSYGLRGK